MPVCYFLSVCMGSSVDQETGNVSLFSLVEQINVPPNAPPPPNGVVPLEVQAYWRLQPHEVSQTFQMRFVMVSVHTKLETSSEVFSHRVITDRFRIRTFGLPYPPVPGHYDLRADWRTEGSEEWSREGVAWPLVIAENTPKPRLIN